MKTEELILRPIGLMSTPFTSKYAAPRQPATSAMNSVGVIRLFPDANFDQAVEDLDGFDFIWVIFWFHENSRWNPKVLPPDGGREKRGVFATRSPHRPNPIGLSLCHLLKISGRSLTVENPDMLDGTPVLDIKPYLPHAEAFPEARSGWIGGGHELTEPPFTVKFAPGVQRILDGMNDREQFEVTHYLTGILARDPHPHDYRRIKPAGKNTFVIAVRLWRFRFRIDNETVNVIEAGRVPS
jgi:tRNA-Thr(GGU) m(6)t(6)A37 methyltransferase TsaA